VGLLIMKDGFYKEDLVDGMKSEATYKDGKLHGKETIWHKNGQVISEATWVDGGLEGEAKTWNEFGQLIGLATYKNDMLHGKSTLWNDEGQLLSETMFEEDRPFGKFTIYKDGVKSKEGIASYPKGDSPYNTDGGSVN